SLSEIGNSVSRKIEKDLIGQLALSARKLDAAISENHQKTLDQLNRNKSAINSMFRFTLLLSIIALILLMLAVGGWSLFMKDRVYTDPYQGLQIETCEFGRSM
ncbi:hypothetical protein, partial [Enterococcus faecium]|uniref:hypothetical protein n=1 Tax=Enterococcus faecium TaxID=1352 RepID=UPI0034E9886C